MTKFKEIALKKNDTRPRPNLEVLSESNIELPIQKVPRAPKPMMSRHLRFTRQTPGVNVVLLSLFNEVTSEPSFHTLSDQPSVSKPSQ